MIYSEPVLLLRYEDSKPLIDKLKSEQPSAIRRLSMTTSFLFGLGMTDDVSKALGTFKRNYRGLEGLVYRHQHSTRIHGNHGSLAQSYLGSGKEMI